MDRKYPKRVNDLVASPKGSQLEKECDDFWSVLDQDLVPADRNLVFLRLLKKMGFDPDGEAPICGWKERKDVLGPLMREYSSLDLGSCAKNTDEDSRVACQEFSGFMNAWNGFGLPYEGEDFSWSVRAPSGAELDEREGNMNTFREKYRLDIRYGSYEFNRSRRVWNAAGVIGVHESHADTISYVCSFPANITASFGDDGVKHLEIRHDPNAQVGRSDVMDTDPPHDRVCGES